MGVAPCEIWKSLSSREFSSAGRASALQAEGQRFDPVNLHHDSLAQSVEQLTFNQWVTGSNPVGLTTVSPFIKDEALRLPPAEALAAL